MHKKLDIKFDKLDIVRVPGARFMSVRYHIGNKKYHKVMADYSNSYKRRLKERIKKYMENRHR